MTTLKLQEVIDNLTNNTKFCVSLLRAKKAFIDSGNQSIDYLLSIDDFSEGVRNSLEYIHEELKLDNNNWGYIKYDLAYERKAAYCYRASNKDGKFVFEIGANRDDDFKSSVKEFEITFTNSKIKKGEKKANYTLNGFPVKVQPFFKEDEEKSPGVFTLTISLDELDLEIPYYVDKELVKNEAIFWELWNKGEAHLTAQKPNYKEFASANKFLQKAISSYLFPTDGVTVLLTKPTLKQFTAKESGDTFTVCEFDVLGISHTDIKCENNYIDKNGVPVSRVYDTKDIGKLSFSTSHKAVKEWASTGEQNVLMLVWFKEVNKKNKSHIPNHLTYILGGDVEDISPAFIDKFENFLEEMDETIESLIPQIQKENRDSWLLSGKDENEDVSGMFTKDGHLIDDNDGIPDGIDDTDLSGMSQGEIDSELQFA